MSCERHDVGEISRRTTDEEADCTFSAIPVCLCLPKTSCSMPGCPKSLENALTSPWWREHAVGRHDCCGTYEYDVPDLIAEAHRRTMAGVKQCLKDICRDEMKDWYAGEVEALQYAYDKLSSLPEPE